MFSVGRLGARFAPPRCGGGDNLAVMADTVSDPVETVLKELAGWAEQAERTGRRLGGDADEARLLLDLLRDYLGIGLADLAEGDLGELLLEIYPRKITVLKADDVDGVIPTARALLTFCRDTGRLSTSKATRLEAELEEIEPRFADAVMNPANWGMARSLTQAMSADGIDFSDQAAVDRWISEYNGGLSALGTSGAGAITPYDEDEELDLAEAFGLPDRLPPLRLPEDGELAEAARASVLLDRARQLSDWVGGEREIIDGYDLAPSDVTEATAALGIDADELAYVWHFADHADFLSFHETYVTTGPTTENWPSAADDEVLDIWHGALSAALSCGLLVDVDANDPAARTLDFDGAGVAIVMALFLARSEGIPAAELHTMIRDGVTAEASPDLAGEGWRAWTEEHGDPARMLLGRLRDLGAVEHHPPTEKSVPEGTEGSDDEVVRLTPLATRALLIQLEEAGVDVPILPPVQEMTAADLIAVAEGGIEHEVDTEMTAWLELRGAEAAADELLATAAAGGAADRLFATVLATRIGAAAEPQWREALGGLPLRPYAKVALAELVEAESSDAPADLEPTPEDLAWLLTDAIAATCRALESEEVADQLREALPPGERPQELLDVMWRLPHPDVAEVLTLAGDHHPDKKVAKAARKAAFKAASRASATR